LKVAALAPLAAAMFLAVNAGAAEPPKQQPAAEVPKLVESVDVRVINVDVVVTDRKGNRVTGLTKDDFELYENGVQKPISNFYEVAAEPKPPVTAAAPATAKPTPSPASIEQIPDNQKRRIIFYVDNLSLAPFNRNRVFKQMKEFATEVMRPGDEAMIATFNRSMKIRVQFTRDPKLIAQTLDTLAGESALGISNRSEKRDVLNRIRDAKSYDEALGTARSYAESVEHDLRQSVESLNGLMTTLAGVEGKKVLVLTSEGFQIQPGREAFYAVDEATHTNGWQGSSMLEGLSFDGTPLIQSVAKTANANGITMYTIHAAGLGAASEGTLAEVDKPQSYTVLQAGITNTTESMQLMADMTGGVASINTNNFARAFKTIEQDLDEYYSLGYRAGTERVDRQRNLEVRIKNHNYNVRNRQTFVEKSTYAEMNDRVIANLLYKTKANDLKIVVTCGSPVPQEDLFKVPVSVRIPLETLTFLPQGEQYVAGFSLYVAVANKEGDMSDVARKQHTITASREDYEKSKGKYYTYSVDLLMEPGINRVSVGVADEVSNVMGFDRQQVIAQDLR